MVLDLLSHLLIEICSTDTAEDWEQAPASASIRGYWAACLFIKRPILALWIEFLVDAAWVACFGWQRENEEKYKTIVGQAGLPLELQDSLGLEVTWPMPRCIIACVSHVFLQTVEAEARL